MSKPVTPICVKVKLSLNENKSEMEKYCLPTVTVSDLLAQVKGGLNSEEKGYTFTCFNDGMKMVETNTLDFYGISDGDIVEIKGVSKSRLNPVSFNLGSISVQNLYMNCYKCGWMLKKKLSSRSTWKKRWILICGNELYYYTNPKDSIPLGKLPIVQSDCLKCLGKMDDKFIISYTGNGEYYFGIDKEEEYEDWKLVIENKQKTKKLQNTVGLIQNSDIFSVVTIDKKQKGWVIFQKGTVYCYESPEETEPMFSFYIHECKIMASASEYELTFRSFHYMHTIKFETQKEFNEWNSNIEAIMKQMGRNIYVDTFITNDYMDKNNIIKEGWLNKEKLGKTFQSKKKRYCILTKNKLFYFDSVPKSKGGKNKAFGCFDLLLASVKLIEPTKIGGDYLMEIMTSEGNYHFTASNLKEIKEWTDAIRTQCSSTPQNVKHESHVTFDLQWDTNGADPNELFELTTVLGTGSFGSVYRAKHRQSEFLLAIKILKISKQKSEMLKAEIDILKTCRSSNVVSYYGTIKLNDDTLWILMDYCGQGSVKDIMKKINKNLNEEQIRYLCNEMLKGLVYLHSIKIIHHDIKAGNVLITDDCKVKLADFGVSQQLNDTGMRKATDFIGSPLFMSPEIVKKELYNYKTDIWSMGMTILEMADGNPPTIKCSSFENLLEFITTTKLTFKEPSNWSVELQTFVDKCLIVDVEQRPDAMGLMFDPFICKGAAPNASCIKCLFTK